MTEPISHRLERLDIVPDSDVGPVYREEVTTFGGEADGEHRKHAFVVAGDEPDPDMSTADLDLLRTTSRPYPTADYAFHWQYFVLCLVESWALFLAAQVYGRLLVVLLGLGAASIVVAYGYLLFVKGLPLSKVICNGPMPMRYWLLLKLAIPAAYVGLILRHSILYARKTTSECDSVCVDFTTTAANTTAISLTVMRVAVQLALGWSRTPRACRALARLESHLKAKEPAAWRRVEECERVVEKEIYASPFFDGKYSVPLTLVAVVLCLGGALLPFAITEGATDDDFSPPSTAFVASGFGTFVLFATYFVILKGFFPVLAEAYLTNARRMQYSTFDLKLVLQMRPEGITIGQTERFIQTMDGGKAPLWDWWVAREFAQQHLMPIKDAAAQWGIAALFLGIFACGLGLLLRAIIFEGRKFVNPAIVPAVFGVVVLGGMAAFLLTRGVIHSREQAFQLKYLRAQSLVLGYMEFVQKGKDWRDSAKEFFDRMGDNMMADDHFPTVFGLRITPVVLKAIFSSFAALILSIIGTIVT